MRLLKKKMIRRLSRMVPTRRRCRFEQLEGRRLLASFSTYEPLNGDTNYQVDGNISSLTDVDYYGFYVEEGSTISLNAHALNPGDRLPQQFDPVIGLFSPDGTPVDTDDDSGTGSGWAAGLSHTATASGVWRVAVSDYDDFDFDGAGGNDDGFGTDTGAYKLTVSGAQEPAIKVVSPENSSEFRLAANPPAMPDIEVEVIGVAPAPGEQLEYNWQTRVQYVAADYPGIRGQRGAGRDIASPAYENRVVTDSTRFDPDFMIGGNEVIRGGRLLLTVTTTVNGQSIEAATPNENPSNNDEVLRILGTNPTNAQVSAYVAGKQESRSWPDGTHDYHVVLRQIIRQESAIQQFDSDSVPLWSQDNLGGVGLFQITNPQPSDDEVWNWQDNVDRGVRDFNGKIAQAIRILSRNRDSLLNRVQREVDDDPANYANVEVAPITGVMIATSAIRGFNGFDNGNGVIQEWREVRDEQGLLDLTEPLPGMPRMTQWEQVPAEDRIEGLDARNVLGEPDYVEEVLGRSDF